MMLIRFFMDVCVFCRINLYTIICISYIKCLFLDHFKDVDYNNLAICPEFNDFEFTNWTGEDNVS